MSVLKRGLLKPRLSEISNPFSGPKRQRHILEEYDLSLKVSFRPNTVRAYNTDIWTYVRDLCDIDFNEFLEGIRKLPYYSDQKQLSLKKDSPVLVNMGDRDFFVIDSVFRAYGVPKSAGFRMDKKFWDWAVGVIKSNEVLYHQKSKNSDNTIQRKMFSLENFRDFLFQQELVSLKTLFLTSRMKKPRKRKRQQVYLDINRLTKLYAQVEKEYEESKEMNKRQQARTSRNRALLYLSSTLSRGSAIAGSRIDNLNLDEKVLYVVEKGDHEIPVPLIGNVYESVRDFVDEHRESYMDIYKVKKKDRKFIFHTKYGEPMKRKGLSDIIDRIAKDAGVRVNVMGKTRVTTHVLRRSFLDFMSESGAPIQSLGHGMNHADVSTTYKYTQMNNLNELRALHKEFNPVV